MTPTGQTIRFNRNGFPPFLHISPSQELMRKSLTILLFACVGSGVTFSQSINGLGFEAVLGSKRRQKGAAKGVSAIATPLAGSIVLSRIGTRAVSSVGFRATSTGFASRGLSIGISGSGASVGQTSFNLRDPGSGIFDNTLTAFAGGAIGQGASNFVKTTGFNTIKQVNRFKAAPRNVGGFLTSPNGRSISTSFGVSGTTSTITSSSFK